MLTCLVSTNAKNIVEYDYDYVDIWFNKIQGNLRVKNLMEITPSLPSVQYSHKNQILKIHLKFLSLY